MLTQEGQLALVLVQQPLHVARHGFHIQGLRTIGQHIGRTVISSNDNKRAAILGIKHIVISHVAACLGHLCVDEFQRLRGFSI